MGISMNKKRWKSAVLALLLALGTISPLSHASEQDIEQAESNIDEYEKQIEEAQELLASLNSKRDDISAYLAELNTAVANKQAEIEGLRAQVAAKQDEIAETELTLADTQEDADRQYENMKLRIQYMYEAGTDDYLNLLFSSQSLTELLSNSEYISQISEYDRDMLDRYQQTLTEIAQYQLRLENDQVQLDRLLAQAEGEQEALNLLAQAQNEQLQQIAAQISQAQGDVEKNQSELAEEEELLAYLEAELERQMQEALRQAQLQAEQAAREASLAASAAESSRQAEEAANQATAGTSEAATGANGGEETPAATTAAGSEAGSVLSLTWPVPVSHRITSYFGPRPNKPVEGVAEYHNAIDIAAPEGSDIVAAADGTVYYVGDGTEVASTAGGYQVWLTHAGGEYMTLYMHCSSLLVQAGQYVHAGDVIARVGSTGLSAGNHLDFRIIYQGTYIDPLGSLVTYP